jgi:predicted thioesterase
VDLVGRSATLERTVTAQDTALALGSGDVGVLATPRLLAWLEATTLLAVDGLPGQVTTVGSRVELAHRRPSPVGQRVRCEATVSAVVGKAIELVVQAVNVPDDATVAEGLVVRVVVDRDGFAASAAAPGG